MFEFLVAISMLYQAVALPEGICRRNGRFLSACRNIFVFNREGQEFVSLLNQTFKDIPDDDHVDSAKNVIRIVAHTVCIYLYFIEQEDIPNHSQIEVILSWSEIYYFNKDDSEVGGYVGDIWNIIQEKYQFKYTLKCLQYQVAKNITENGQADVYLSASVAEENLVNSYFSQPYFYNWYHLYLRTPEFQASSLSYLKTFSTDLWFLMATVFLLLTVTLWLNGKIINIFVRMEPNVSIPSCFLTAISGFINQGHDLRLRSLSGRSQVLAALFFGTVLYAAMNAILFSRLAIKDVRFPFSSLWDISRKSDLSVCLRNNSFVYETIMTNKGEILPVWEGILNNKNCLDVTDQDNIPRLICKKGIIILENRVVMSAIAKRSAFPCETAFFHKKYFQQGNVFVMTKAFIKKRVIEKMMMGMRSYGIFKRLEDQHIKSRKSASDGKNWNEVTMEHIRGVLYMYFCAIAISLVVLVIEITLHRRRH